MKNTIYKLFSALIRPLVGSGIGRNHMLAYLYRMIITRILPNTAEIAEIEGFKMRILRGRYVGDIATELLLKGMHQPATTRIFKALLKQGDCVVDIGAHVGYFTMMAAQLVGWRGKVFAFEPDSTNMRALYANIELNKFENIEPCMMALSNCSGESTFYISSRESARHSLIKTREHDDQITVNVAKLDDIILLKKYSIKLIKTDTEGNELAVLQGARQTIMSNYSVKLIVEVYQDALKACGTTVEGLWNYITGELGLSIVYLIDDYANKVKPINNLAELGKRGLACNLLCTREPIDISMKARQI
jgi:FkbM family methyltransferase